MVRFCRYAHEHAHELGPTTDAVYSSPGTLTAQGSTADVYLAKWDADSGDLQWVEAYGSVSVGASARVLRDA